MGEQKPLGKSPLRGNPSSESTYLPTYTLLRWPYNTLSTNAPIKQASLRNSGRSLIERWVEPLGNLNKVYRAHFAWPTISCVCDCTSMHGFTVNLRFFS